MSIQSTSTWFLILFLFLSRFPLSAYEPHLSARDASDHSPKPWPSKQYGTARTMSSAERWEEQG
jgi:hypothetical protein